MRWGLFILRALYLHHAYCTSTLCRYLHAWTWRPFSLPVMHLKSSSTNLKDTFPLTPLPTVLIDSTDCLLSRFLFTFLSSCVSSHNHTPLEPLATLVAVSTPPRAITNHHL
ncbi:hypothetical protein BDM02DRAFT_935741 [Thelephora ganbajun]|uniref:Uncharacterized protein n=1 Tax=Thelephora ganbajun TaxID=370292 RepID=A0ACB6Z4E3_THEGA|nr:hypothetical protein BDM02DRAFT_935741 [Thelephora ganbajun]